MEQSRRLNIVKALCIILMVVGHSDPPAGLHGFIYLFHMPAFFFLSGYLFKESWLDRPGGFIKKRLGTLYAPYVFWELVFLLLGGLFFRLHLADTQLTGREMLSQAFKYITFRGHQPLLNGYWFLKTLFFCSTGCFFVLKLFPRKPAFLAAWIAGLLAAAGCCRLVPFDTTMISRLLLACAFYLSGFLFARFRREIPLSVALAAMAAVAVISLFWRETIFVDGWGVLLYYPVALLGIIGVFGIAAVLDRWDPVARFLDFTGRATLTILTFHFLGFRLVSLLNIHSWLLYSLAGIALPLLVYLLYNSCGHPSGSRKFPVKLF